MSNEEHVCEICGYSFNKLSSLKSHRSKSDYCKRLVNSLLICKKCYNIFDNLREYNDHKCDSINNDIKDLINNKNQYINNLKNLNNMYRDIIETNLNIKLNSIDVFTKNCEKYKKDVFNVKSLNEEVTPVLSIKQEKSQKNTEIKDTPIVKKRKPVIKDRINLKEVDKKGCDDLMEKNMKELENARAYNKVLITIKKIRNEYFKFYNIDDYEKILDKNTQDIKSILQTKFTNDDKKINKTIKKSISPIEMRIYNKSDFEKTNIEIDDIEIYKNCIGKYYTYNQRIFNYDDFIIRFLNYNISLFSIKDLVKLFLNECNSIVYIKTNDKYPFSFYYRDKIKQKKTYWKNDCRLEKLVSSFIPNVSQYCINLYRNIYKNIYHDNDYRDIMTEDYEVLYMEGKTLINNILVLSDIYNFTLFLQKYIMDNHEYKPTNTDILNIKSDDLLDKERFIELEQADFTINKRTNIQLLFDNISEQDITKIIENTI